MTAVYRFGGFVLACFALCAGSVRAEGAGLGYAAGKLDGIQRAAIYSQVVGTVVDLIDQEYIYTADPELLVDGCSRELEKAVPGLAIPTIQVTRDGALAIREAAWRAFNQARYYGRYPGRDVELADACARGMANVLVQSEYLDAWAAAAFKGTPGAVPAGIGVELRAIPPDVIQVEQAFETAPAGRAGMWLGDRLLSIDGKDVSHATLATVVELLRGETGTPVRVEVRRPGTGEQLVFHLQREQVSVDSVRWQVIADDVVYLGLSRFGDLTRRKVVDGLITAARQTTGMPKGIILDLRRNPGGLFSAGLETVELFLPKGVLLASIEQRNISGSQWYFAGDLPADLGRRQVRVLPAELASLPMVVLVDRITASGAEVVAAAFKVHRRARIIGERTAGVGLVQTVFPVNGRSMLKLTNARIHTPDGRPLGDTGVVPDEIWDPSESSDAFQSHADLEEDALVQRALQILRGK